MINVNYALLQVMSRFGLSLGVGDKTVQEVCTASGVDCNTFLAIVNFMTEGFVHIGGDGDDISIPALIDYLRQSHLYFLDFSLPAIRKELLEAIEFSKDDISFLILKFFDEYMHEVRKHMEYEDKMVFSYVEGLLNGETPPVYKIATYSKHHEQVGETLSELKNILITYCPEKVDMKRLT